MSQAIWRSPLLPRLSSTQVHTETSCQLPCLGSGTRFKQDMLSYFRGYGPGKLQNLISNLERYDFTAVRGALVASVPGRQSLQSVDPDAESFWGWPGLKRILSFIPCSPTLSNRDPAQAQIIAQVSSVAAIGEKWLNTTFFPTLSTTRIANPPSQKRDPKVSIIFPTADEIRRSINGYEAGASIHMKISSPAQAKQLNVLRPMLCHWAGDQRSKDNFFGAKSFREAGRRRAAPHIKTYVRFKDASTMDEIEWAMVTSANLSTQAWGGAAGPGGEVRICSYEIGVVVWPGLWDDEVENHGDEGDEGKARMAVMVPTFKSDKPSPTSNAKDQTTQTHKLNESVDSERGVTVGWRMPYDLPLVPYTAQEKPWCASEPCSEPDWMGRIWPGNGK